MEWLNIVALGITRIIIRLFFTLMLMFSSAVTFAACGDIFDINDDGKISLSQGISSKPNRFFGMLATGLDSLNIWKGRDLLGTAESDLFFKGVSLPGAVWEDIDLHKSFSFILGSEFDKGDNNPKRMFFYIPDSKWPFRLVLRDNKEYKIQFYSKDYTEKRSLLANANDLSDFDQMESPEVDSIVHEWEQAECDKNTVFIEIRNNLNYLDACPVNDGQLNALLQAIGVCLSGMVVVTAIHYWMNRRLGSGLNL